MEAWPLLYPNSFEWHCRASKVTPCASQTLSKRAQSFVEGAYPCFVTGGKGAHVWDMDGFAYLDFICGLGCITLGYGREEINEAIIKQLEKGISFSLPTELEAMIAERLVKKIPCAEQIRFVKTGSEACTAAMRIARMVTGKDVILFCGYHGWHSEYTSSCTYAPGIPKEYAFFNIQFPYNDLSALDKLLWRHEGLVAAIMMEPAVHTIPHDGYLQGVKSMAREHGALLIFDEMITSGRWALAGGQEYFKVVPDLATYGKFLGNGMPLACIAGPEDIMKYAWMVSGTFGGETLSLAACGAVLDIYEKEIVIDKLWNIGANLKEMLNAAFLANGLDAYVDGYPVRPRIVFRDDPDRVQMSVLLQELAKAGVLMHPGGLNVSAAMTMENVRDCIQRVNGIISEPLTVERLQGLPYQNAIRQMT